MPASVIKAFTGITTTGVQPQMLSAQGTPFNIYSVQVKGVAAAPTSWSVTLEGSNNGVDFTVLITHTTPDGSTQFAVDKPCVFIRVNVGALSLGSATSIGVFVAASG
jgi:hypothetical protein